MTITTVVSPAVIVPALDSLSRAAPPRLRRSVPQTGPLPCELAKRGHDFLLGERDGAAAALAQRINDLPEAQGLLDRGAFGDGLVYFARNGRRHASLEARIHRRAVQRLGREQARQLGDLPGPQQLAEAKGAAEQAAAGAHGVMMLSGALKPRSSQISYASDFVPSRKKGCQLWLA